MYTSPSGGNIYNAAMLGQGKTKGNPTEALGSGSIFAVGSAIGKAATNLAFLTLMFGAIKTGLTASVPFVGLVSVSGNASIIL